MYHARCIDFYFLLLIFHIFIYYICKIIVSFLLLVFLLDTKYLAPTLDETYVEVGCLVEIAKRKKAALCTSHCFFCRILFVNTDVEIKNYFYLPVFS